ncbi:MAG: NADH-quinone oxidoreductase subunit N, partial [Pseudomonadota bacterium]|nr:NADH-quinone oxidoreductase subunit N [Pseudomonadota bacterium]
MFEFQMADIMAAVPEIFLAGVGLVLVLVAAYGGEGARNARRVTQIAMAGILVTLVLVLNGDEVLSSAFGGMFSADSFAAYMKVLVLLGTLAALGMSLRTEGDDDINKPEYSLLVLLALVGMMLMISADNLMALYMG